MEQHYRNWLIIRINAASVPAARNCREWIKTRNAKGYGLISVTLKPNPRVMMAASRAMYLATTGKLLPRHVQVLHTCDNPACVNFDHLFEGTAKDNAQDCIAKGRRAPTHRKHKRMRKFTDDEIRAIRSATGKLLDIAEQLGVSVSYVSKLKRGLAKSIVE